MLLKNLMVVSQIYGDVLIGKGKRRMDIFGNIKKAIKTVI